ncbi:MAG: ribosome recycling factor [Paraglaciecola sp.]|jgi:ribosome recycling factor
MQEEIDLILEISKEGMGQSIDHLKNELSKIRAGKASTAMLDGIKVEYYGTPTGLGQVANVSTADAKTLIIQPWEKSMLAPIERAIFEANLGLTPMNDGEMVRINIPPLTEERRRDLAKSAKKLGEDAKIGLRSTRHKGMDGIKKAVKDGYPEDAGKKREIEIQEMTNGYSKRVEEMLVAKEKDIMKV